MVIVKTTASLAIQPCNQFMEVAALPTSLRLHVSQWLQKLVLRVLRQFILQISRDMTKPTKWLCAQRRLRSAWASAQSDQNLRCPHEESLGP